MTRSALLFKVYELFLDELFVISSVNGGSETSERPMKGELVSRKVVSFGPTTNLSLLFGESAKIRLRELLKLYIMEGKGLTAMG